MKNKEDEKLESIARFIWYPSTLDLVYFEKKKKKKEQGKRYKVQLTRN